MNKHLIYQEDAIKLLDDLENQIAEEEGWQEKCDGVFQAKELIDKCPAVDAEPVRHGRWINPRLNKYGHPCHQCNQCLFVASQKDRNFCPDCGAKMDLKE